MRVKSLALGAMLGVSAATAASAQQAPEFPTVDETRRFQVDGRLTAYHDTNIARTGKETAELRGVSPDDSVLTPALTASVVQSLGQQMVFLEGSAGYDFHKENPQLDRGRYQVLAGGAAQVGICRPTVFGTYSAFQSDLADVDLRTISNFQETVGYAAGMQCGQERGFGGVVIAQRTDTKNSADTMVVQDYTAESLMGGLTYGNPTLANISLLWVYANNEFPNRINPGRPVGDGFWTQTIAIKVERKLGGRINVGGTVGSTYLKREFAPPGARLDLRGTTYDATVSYRAGTRMLVEVFGARQVQPSNQAGKLYDISEILEGRIRYKLNPRINLTAGHTYTDLVYNVDTVGARAVITDSLTNATYASLEYRGFRNAKVQLDVRREHRDTNLPVFNYSATRVGITTTIGF